jgi:hypothetical protein
MSEERHTPGSSREDFQSSATGGSGQRQPPGSSTHIQWCVQWSLGAFLTPMSRNGWIAERNGIRGFTMLRRLLVVVALACLAAPAAASASASRQVELVTVDETLIRDHGCGFPIIEHQSGTFRIATFFDSAGVPTKSIITIRSPYVVTESANGKTLLGVSPFVTKIIYDQDGGVISQTLTGLSGVFRIPHGGVLVLDTGRLLEDAEGNVLFEAGPHPLHHGTAQAQLCNYFAS